MPSPALLAASESVTSPSGEGVGPPCDGGYFCARGKFSDGRWPPRERKQKAAVRAGRSRNTRVVSILTCGSPSSAVAFAGISTPVGSSCARPSSIPVTIQMRMNEPRPKRNRLHIARTPLAVIRHVDPPSRCFVPAQHALEEDPVVSSLLEIIVPSEPAERFMTQSGSRSQCCA
jgi:hypothetical protein